MRDTNASTSGGPLVKNGKSPVFLGVSIECDPDYQRKLGNLFTAAFNQAGEAQRMIDDFK